MINNLHHFQTCWFCVFLFNFISQWKKGKGHFRKKVGIKRALEKGKMKFPQKGGEKKSNGRRNGKEQGKREREKPQNHSEEVREKAARKRHHESIMKASMQQQWNIMPQMSG